MPHSITEHSPSLPQDKYVVKTLLLEPHITPAAAPNDIDPELLRLLIAVRAAASEPAAAAAAATPAPAAAAAAAGAGASEFIDGGAAPAEKAKPPAAAAGLIRCGYPDVLALHDPGWTNPELREKITRACAALLAAAGPEAAAWLGTAEELAESSPRLNVNSHGVGAHLHADGSSNSDLAVGLFPMLSMLNHSCRRVRAAPVALSRPPPPRRR